MSASDAEAVTPVPQPSPLLAAIEAELESSRGRLRAAVDTVPDGALDRRPAPDSWSPGEILHHLVLVEGQVAVLLEQGIREAAARGAEPEPPMDAVLRSIDHLEIDRGTGSVRSPAHVMPERGWPREDLLRGLAATRRALLATLRSSGGVDLSAVRRPHALLGPLDLYQWLLFVARHEDRHRFQLERAVAILDGC